MYVCNRTFGSVAKMMKFGFKEPRMPHQSRATFTIPWMTQQQYRTISPRFKYAFFGVQEVNRIRDGPSVYVTGDAVSDVLRGGGP